MTVDGYHGKRGSAVLNWAAALPPNDNFANAITLVGGNGQVAGSNVGATLEAGEPTLGTASVWWTWTAVANGAVTVDTLGSDFNTVLGVYTGSSVATLTPIATNDNFATTNQSRVDFATVAGTTYHIAVDGATNADQGSIVLRYAFTFRPGAAGDYKITYKDCQIATDFSAAARNLTVTSAQEATIAIQKLTKVPANPVDIAGKVLYVLGSPGLDSLTASTGTIKSLTCTGAFIPTVTAEITASVKMGVVDTTYAAPSTVISIPLAVSPGAARAAAPTLKASLTGVSLDGMDTLEAASIKIAAKKTKTGTVPANVPAGAQIVAGPGLSLGVTNGDMLADLVRSTGSIKSLTVSKGGTLGQAVDLATLQTILTSQTLAVPGLHLSSVVVSGLHAGPWDEKLDGVAKVSADTINGIFVAGANLVDGFLVQPTCDASVLTWNSKAGGTGDAFVKTGSKTKPSGITEHTTAP